MLHNHSFTYHPHYIMFLSQYFSFPCHYHSTNAPYPFIHLPPTLYNVSPPVLQFSPVSTIPPMLYTHSFTYHPHYIMLLSQHFSFPLSVPFHQRSLLISSTCCSYHKDKRAKPVNMRKAMLFFESTSIGQKSTVT